MNYIKRDLESSLQQICSEYSCVLLVGPRQVGKSTLFQHIDSSRERVSLDDLQARELAKKDPEMFLKIHKAPVLIDEVQYAPELFPYIKIAIDNGAPPSSYLLTGSQSFKLMKLAQESLAGRVAVLSLNALSQHEIFSKNKLSPFSISLDYLKEKEKKSTKADITEIYSRIWEGGLPGLISKKYTNRDVYYSSYFQTYISRDIKEEVEIEDSSKFLDFIRSAACRIGQELVIHSIAKDVDISDDTAKRWLRLLEKAEIIFFLHPYSNNLLKRTIKSPKLYFFDTGLVAYLTRYSTPEILMNGSISGAILENYVISEIRKTFFNLAKEPYIYYYRDKDQNEIDLIIEENEYIYPIEIKKTYNPTKDMVKTFSLLNKAEVKLGTGAIICMKESLTALDTNTLIIPIWML